MTPFDYVKAINYTKSNLIVDDLTEKEYNPFIVNRALSMGMDTVLQANEMNRSPHLEKRLQFDFLLNTLRTRKRYTPWLKAKKEKYLEYVKEYYGYSNEKAKSALNILNDEQLKTIMNSLDKGGKHGK